jgi:hypothetical protein
MTNTADNVTSFHLGVRIGALISEIGTGILGIEYGEDIFEEVSWSEHRPGHLTTSLHIDERSAEKLVLEVNLAASTLTATLGGKPVIVDLNDEVHPVITMVLEHIHMLDEEEEEDDE